MYFGGVSDQGLAVEAGERERRGERGRRGRMRVEKARDQFWSSWIHFTVSS